MTKAFHNKLVVARRERDVKSRSKVSFGLRGEELPQLRSQRLERNRHGDGGRTRTLVLNMLSLSYL